MSTSEFARQATRGFAWNHIYRIVDYGLWNVFMAVIARQLGPTVAAPFVYYMAIAMPLALIGTLGVDGVLLRFLARVSHDGRDSDGKDLTALPLEQFLTRLFSFRLVVTLIVVALVFVLLVLMPMIIPSTAAAIGSLGALAPFLMVFLAGQAMTSFATFALIGLLRVQEVFVASLISRSLLIIGLVIMLFTHSVDVWNAVAIHSASVLLNAVLLLYSLNRIVRSMRQAPEQERRKLIKPILEVLRELRAFVFKPTAIKFFLLTPVMLYGITTWGSDLLSSVLGRQPDIVMMRIFFGEHSKEIGYYQVACQVLLMTEYICLFGLSGAIVSVFSSLVHKDENDPSIAKGKYPSLARARREVMSFQVVVILPLCTFMFAFAPRLILLVFGKEYIESESILRWGLLILAANIALVGGGVHITSLVTIGKERMVFRYRLFWGATNLIVNYFLILHYGALGALFGTQLANLAACVTESIKARSLIGSAFDARNTLAVASIATVSAAFAYYLIDLLTPSLALFWQLAFGSILSIGSCLLLYYVFRLRSARGVFDRGVGFLSPARNLTTAANP